MSVRRALAAALLVPLALLSACTEDEPVPQMPDPTTSIPSPTDSSPTAAPETPEEFVRRFMVAEVAMQNTGVSDAYRAMTQGCEACDSMAVLVECYYQAGGYVRLKPWRIVSVKPFPERGPTAYAAVVQASVTRFKESSSDQEETFPGGRSTYLYEVESDGPDLKVTYTSELAS